MRNKHDRVDNGRFWPAVCLAPVAIALLGGVSNSAPGSEAKLLEMRCIWDRAPDNDFTDLARHKGKWLLVFREATGHCSTDGKIRVLTSADGEKWTSAALIAYKGENGRSHDLRDPKICVDPDGHLMINSCVWLRPDINGKSHQSLVYFSEDGENWSPPHEIGDPNVWIWRATWHKGTCYGTGYRKTFQGNCRQIKTFLRLYKTTDGVSWKTVADDIFREGPPHGEKAYVYGETAEVWTEDDTCYTLLRTHDYEEPENNKLTTTYLGMAKPPYTEWTWKNLRIRSGGPFLFRLPDGRLLAPWRPAAPEGTLSTLCWVDTDKAQLRPFFSFPPGYDIRYTGVVLHDGLLWLTSSSKDEGKNKIFLFKFRISPLSVAKGE